MHTLISKFDVTAADVPLGEGMYAVDFENDKLGLSVKNGTEPGEIVVSKIKDPSLAAKDQVNSTERSCRR